MAEHPEIPEAARRKSVLGEPCVLLSALPAIHAARDAEVRERLLGDEVLEAVVDLRCRRDDREIVGACEIEAEKDEVREELEAAASGLSASQEEGERG